MKSGKEVLLLLYTRPASAIFQPCNGAFNMQYLYCTYINNKNWLNSFLSLIHTLCCDLNDLISKCSSCKYYYIRRFHSRYIVFLLSVIKAFLLWIIKHLWKGIILPFYFVIQRLFGRCYCAFLKGVTTPLKRRYNAFSIFKMYNNHFAL